MVVGQTHVFDLETILADLSIAESKTTEDLYTFIYRRAWDVLNDPERELFLAFLQVFHIPQELTSFQLQDLFYRHDHTDHDESDTTFVYRF